MALVRHGFLNVWTLLMLTILTLALPMSTPAHADESATNQVDWQEPHGVSIIDMIGEVPDTVLHDAIIMYSNNGMLQYESGQRVGDLVTINVRVIPRYGGSGSDEHTLVGCLGQPGLTDTWPVVSPASTMRVFENGNDISAEIFLQRYAPGGRIYPPNGPTEPLRYPEGMTTAARVNEQGEIPIPTNRGCALVFRGYRTNLTATIKVQSPKYVRMRMISSESFVFHSYIGPGATGEIGGLAGQMQSRYGNRHDKFDLTIPAGTEFALVTFPPTPVHPYVNEPIDLNLQQPGSGTYRIGRLNSLNMSVDHAISAPIPLYWQTRDVDQSGGAEYLPAFTDPGYLASLEYFVPVGIDYDTCMRPGGDDCPNDLLEAIYNAEMTMTIHYLTIERLTTGLDRIPLRQVGPSWAPNASIYEGMYLNPSQSIFTIQEAGTLPGTIPQGALLLPLIFSDRPADLPPDDRTGCPCGWFDPDGRMLDFIPAP